MRAAAIQMSCIPADTKANLEKATALLDRAVKQGVRWAVLPELFSTGYHTEGSDHTFASSIPCSPLILWLQEQAQRCDLFLTAGLVEALPEGNLADTAVTISPEGVVLDRYRKCHLWAGEELRFEAGQCFPTPFELEEGWSAATQICYEVGFPEGARLGALQGANVLSYCAAFGLARTYAWELATRARALENGCYVVAANLCGSEQGSAPFAGRSCIISPRGCVLAQVDEGDGLAIADLELSEVELRRFEIPYLRDLNRDLVVRMWHHLSERTTLEHNPEGGSK